MRSIEENEQQLQSMVDYNVETRTKSGNEGWVDTIVQSRDQYRRNSQVYTDILKAVDERIKAGEERCSNLYPFLQAKVEQ